MKVQFSGKAAETVAKMDEERPPLTSYQIAILGGMQFKAKGMVYGGGANPKKVAARRAKNRVASKSRRGKR